ncbi:MAG: hypothetical protein ACRCR9_00135 [Chitinophagaceae bacterium]
MRKFLITNPQVYEGEIQVIYDEKDGLCMIDFRDTNRSVKGRYHTMQNIPMTFEELTKYPWGIGNTASCTEVTIEVPFEEFWEKYDQKKNKNRCIKLWATLGVKDRILALRYLPKYFKYTRVNNISKKDPDTYLRNKNWEDEL